MLNRSIRALTASVITLSLLAGCIPPTALSPASSSTQEWNITPMSQQQVPQPATQPSLRNTVPTQAPSQNHAVSKKIDDSPHREQSGAAGEFLASQAHGLAQSAAQNWLSQFGTARLSIGQIGQGGNISGSLDMLFPLYEAEDDKQLIFTQLGARHSSRYTDTFRTTLNAGVGYRQIFDAEYPYMLGANAFYDQDMTVGHQRLGLGLEYWMDNLKVAANGYFPLSDWKKSPDLARYLERPATGFDIRAEGYLPMYPQLGGKLMYEQYFGDEVGLFGPQNRQSNPHAWTVGATYTPVPAVTLGLDHKMGDSGMHSTNATIEFKYQIGVPFAKQWNADNVAPSRKLGGMFHDLVDRNNEIILEYKRDIDPESVGLPSAIAGYPGAEKQFAIEMKGLSASTIVQWRGSAASFVAPHVAGSLDGSLTLPAYKQAGVNSYVLIATATGDSGTVTSNPMTVTVQPIAVEVTASKAQALADGTDAVMFTALVRGVENEPMADLGVTWSVPNDVNVMSKENKTDAAGKARITINSVNALSAPVKATDEHGFEGEDQAVFIGDKSTARVSSLVALPVTILANNTATATLTATVTDARGNPVGAGVPVTWSGDLSGSSTTDSNSQAVFIAPAGTTPKTISVKAATDAADPGKTATVAYAIDLSGAKVDNLVAAPASILANGAATSTLTATVTDAFGNPVGVGVEVTWSGDLSGSSTTNASSQAVFTTPAATVPKSINVKATASAADAGKTATVTYDIDVSGAVVKTLVASPSSILANGSDTSTLTATVTDAYGNPVGAGVAVTWSGGLSGSSTTNAGSQAIIVVPSTTTPKTITVMATASAADAGKTATVQYQMDMSGLKVNALVASPSPILANGASTSTLTATVTDAFGNLAGSGVTVAWGGDLSSSSTTDGSSQAIITTPTATVAKTISVTARVASTSDSGKTTSVSYVIDLSGAKVTVLVTSAASILANNSDTATLTATVEDAFGNPVGAGAAVAWSGGLTGSSTTNASSQAMFTVPAGTVPKTISVSAKVAANVSDPGKSVSVEYKMDMSGVKVLSLVATPTSILANGSATSALTATVTDAYGNLVGAGVPISWSTNLGTLISANTATNSGGKALATLRAGTVAGTATVHAIVNARDSATAIILKSPIEDGGGSSQWNLSYHPNPGTTEYVQVISISWKGVGIYFETRPGMGIPYFPGPLVKGDYIYYQGALVLDNAGVQRIYSVKRGPR